MHVVDLTELRTMCAAASYVEKLARIKKEGEAEGKMTTLKAIISMDEDVSEAARKTAAE